MSITVPKSVKADGLSLAEVEAYFSLTPVPNADDDYDYDKIIGDILEVFLSTRDHASKGAKNVKKHRLRKMLDDEKLQKNSRVFKDFDTWRLAQIRKYGKAEGVDKHEYDNKILQGQLDRYKYKNRQLTDENKQLKEELRLLLINKRDDKNISTSKSVSTSTQTETKNVIGWSPTSSEEPKLVVEPPKMVLLDKEEKEEKVEKVNPYMDKVKKVKKMEFKMEDADYDDFEDDDEKKRYYYDRQQVAHDLVISMFATNYKYVPGKKDKNIYDLESLFIDFVDDEMSILEENLEEETSEAEDHQLEHRYLKMLKSQLNQSAIRE